MKRNDPLSVGQIIEMAISGTGNRDEFERQQACYLWQEVVGPAINRYTVRRWIEHDVMHVQVVSASLKSDLSFRKEDIVREICRLVGKNIISSIVIH